MNTGEIYKLIREKSAYGSCYFATVVKGENAGAKFVYTEQAVFYADPVVPEVPVGTVTGKYAPGLCETENGTVFIEKIGKKPRIVICGGGHVSLSLVKLLKQIGFECWVLEDRPDFAGHATQAGADKVICDMFDSALQAVPDSPDNFFVLMTRGHRYDEVCLRHIFTEKKYAYIGMMASKKRGAAMKETLLTAGFDAEEVNSIHTPIGLSIGAETPEEIAVSVAAELVKVKSDLGKSAWIPDELYKSVIRNEERQALCVIVDKKGSAPRKPGTRMLVRGDGTIQGTVGGGCMEAEVITAARRGIQLHGSGYTDLVKVYMTEEDAENAGMVCGGVIDVFIEVL